MAKRGPKPKYTEQSCHNEHCKSHGKIGLGNVVSKGTYQSRTGQVRQFLCRHCQKTFTSTKGTFFYDLRTKKKKILMALKLLVKGMPLRGIAEVLEVKLDTVRGWLKKAGEHSAQITPHLLKELKVKKVELDALWSFVKKKSLRKRALLWKAKSTLAPVLLRSLE